MRELLAEQYAEHNTLSKVSGSTLEQEHSFIDLFAEKCIDNKISLIALNNRNKLIAVMLLDDAYPEQRDFKEKVTDMWQEQRHRFKYGG